MTDTPLCLEPIKAAYLNPCGPCDAGLPTTCTCGPDPRGVILDLVAEVKRLRALLADVAAMAE